MGALTRTLNPEPLAPPPPMNRARVLFLAASLALTVPLVAGVLWMWWLGSIAAVVMGHVALRQIAQSGGTQSGRKAALAGLAVGYFALTVLLAIIVFSVD